MDREVLYCIIYSYYDFINSVIKKGFCFSSTYLQYSYILLVYHDCFRYFGIMRNAYINGTKRHIMIIEF